MLVCLDGLEGVTMLVKNMAERVTRRRAEAYYRLTGNYPVDYVSEPKDTKWRLGRAKRRNVARKYLP